MVAVADAFDAMTSTRSLPPGPAGARGAGGAAAVRGDAVRPADGAGAGQGAGPARLAAGGHRGRAGRCGADRPAARGRDDGRRDADGRPQRRRCRCGGARRVRAPPGAAAVRRRPEPAPVGATRRHGESPSRAPSAAVALLSSRSASPCGTASTSPASPSPSGCSSPSGSWPGGRALPGGTDGSATPRRSAPPGRWRTRCSGSARGQATHHGCLQVVAVVVAAALVGCRAACRARAAGPTARPCGAAGAHRRVRRRLLPTPVQPGELEHWLGHGPYYALFLLAAARADRPVRRRARRRAAPHARTGWPVRAAAARRAAGARSASAPPSARPGP